MDKIPLKIVMVGHVDHGKSTLIGSLLLETNSIAKEKLQEIKRISKELGKEAELAFLADQLKEEREKNITIDTTQIFFKTHKRNYVIIDAPGHIEFIKNMITGASQAEAAVLLVDAKEGIMEQTRRHMYLIHMLGIERVIVLCNKLDLLNYNEEKFNKLKKDLLQFLGKLSIKPLFVIPVSAKKGVNISKPGSHIKWYKGPSVLAALDSLKHDSHLSVKALRLPVQDVYEIDGEDVIVGKVASGVITEGQDVLLLPSNKKARVKSIKSFEKEKHKAEEGENIGLILDSKSTIIPRGEVVVGNKNIPKPSENFKGNIFWMASNPLEIGKEVTLRCATQTVKGVVEKIDKRINSSTLEIIEEDASELKTNEAGQVLFKTQKPLIVERFSFIEELGRFVIERNYNTDGAGIIV